MKKKIVMMTTALMMVAGVVGGMSEQNVKAASKKVSISKKNFPDQVFRELVKKNFDENKDNKLSAKEIKKAKKFGSASCKNSVKIKKSKYGKYTTKYVKNIKSFKGIEKLTNLQKLVANETSVKTINLKKNKKLTYLEMTDGRLKKMDLNSCKKLKYVYLEYNQLTSLKMNKCKKLLYVNLTGHMVKKVKINRNKKTKVIGEKYYVPYKATQISNKFAELNAAGRIEADGNYCVYEWATDNSSCMRNVIRGTSVVGTAVNMDANTVAKAKSMQKITAQWKDSQGNFYFLADKDGNMVANTVYYLFRVNPQGSITAELKLGDEVLKDSFGGRKMMKALQITDDQLVIGVTSRCDGILYINTKDMKITKLATCNFEPATAYGDVVAGYYSDSVYVSKYVEKEKKNLDNNTEIGVGEFSGNHSLKMPLRYYGRPNSIQICNNYLYLISGEGFFKAKLTAKKFTQLYGISKLSDMQQDDVKFMLTVKNEKEIYLITEETEEDENNDGEKNTYMLQKCVIG